MCSNGSRAAERAVESLCLNCGAGDSLLSLSCARAAANSCPRVRLRARVVYFCVQSCTHELRLCARAFTPSVPEKIRAKAGMRRLYLLLQNSCGYFRRRTFVLLGYRPCPSELYGRILGGLQSLRER